MYGWPGIKVRWCTGQLKTHLIAKEVNRLKKEKNALHYIGIAADESQRCKDDPNHRYPLVEWGITEAQALQICYDRGFDFGGLYKIYHRASCWCCPLQRIGELRKLRQHHPELWARLWDMDNRARAQFGAGPLGQFKVSERTIRRDIAVLMCSYPIETVCGGHGGGVRIADGFYLTRQSRNRQLLDSKQSALLRKLSSKVEGDDLDTLNSILLQFAP